MNNQEIVTVLQECKQMLDAFALEVSEPSEEEKNDYQRCEASFPDDLKTLIQEAKEMKWPFVPERWQYKQAVRPEDKTNLQDMINARLHDLLVFLKASIAVAESITAAAIVFLIDRFLYWADASIRLLQVAKALHKVWPATPIAPQVVIRQARISANSGSWQYTNQNDKVLVQSVCIQIRGQILQKLGMWYEAAELIWASIVGFSELPIPDKKGISTSLGILADIFISMSKEDYQRFKMSSHVCLSSLEEFDHQLLSAAESCKLAATFSLYTPLFVLINLNIRGTCLLSYSLSKDCPMELKPQYLTEAKEAFEIGLLTKKEGDKVTSKQELHCFVKSAFCLANVHKWLHNENVRYEHASQLCREAVEKLANYSRLSEKQDKGNLAGDIMYLVFSVRELLNVQTFPKFDENCYVPQKYWECMTKPVVNGKVGFKRVLDMYSRHHNSVCQVLESTCTNHKAMEPKVKSGACITVLKTLDTLSTADNISEDNDSLQSGSLQRRNRLIRSNAVSFNSDEGKRRTNLFCVSHSSSSSNSWCNLSNTSSSWESVSNDNENKLSNDCNPSKENMDHDFAVAEPPMPGESQENNDFANRSFQNLSIEEKQEALPQNIPISTSINNQIDKMCSATETSLNSGCQTECLSLGHEASSRFVANGNDQSAGSEPFEMIDYLAETESATHDVSSIGDAAKEEQVFKNIVGRKLSDTTVDPEGETKDDTEDRAIVIPESTFNLSPRSSNLGNIFRSKHSGSSSEGRSFDTDQATDTKDEKKTHVLQQQISTDSSSSKRSLLLQKSKSSAKSTDSPISLDYACESTEEGENNSLNSSHGSNSWKTSQFSRHSSESMSWLNSSSSSYVFLHAKHTEQACLLDDTEYEKFLAGVEHDWLMERLEDTGVFSFTHLNQAYDALLLKFSKKSGLWTAQETVVHCGDNVAVTKPGKQRNAFWIHFLHQDETLARYVGKEYKKPKELLYHFSDVERQMTAQYYVTEFNKRLYELNILTQIFYIPSFILLILEDKCIKGCVSVEPYILGEFVKLSNNAQAVKTQYEATKYGLAFGHFTYEFSDHSDIVVDLQGWVTESKKGEALIYLTDPQIHSVQNNSLESSSKGVSTCINFGKKGIDYFFSCQHTECNEICASLSLTRPDLTELKKSLK
uniref:Alpha kinase 1 n=1 Tax=Xenopus tropicalis TaxID=8364 RepID=A0A6I8QX94_XENTR